MGRSGCVKSPAAGVHLAKSAYFIQAFVFRLTDPNSHGQHLNILLMYTEHTIHYKTISSANTKTTKKFAAKIVTRFVYIFYWDSPTEFKKWGARAILFCHHREVRSALAGRATIKNDDGRGLYTNFAKLCASPFVAK